MPHVGPARGQKNWEMSRMTRFAWTTGAAAIALLAVAAVPATAADNCVRVLGYEWSGEKQSMDPSGMWSGDEGYHIFAVYNRLMDVDSNFKLVPELAESWSVSEDGKTWTFTLRQGVKFHDGSDFDASDVVYSFKRIFDPALDTGGKQVLTFLDPEGIKAVDDHTVTFTTKEPVGELPLLITNKFTNIVADGAKAADLKLKGNGTGPFMQDQFTPNAPVRVLKKNPNYWKAGLPKAECLRITVAQEPASAMAQIKAGEVDLVLNVDPVIIPALKDDPNVELLETAASNSMTLSMWVDTPPFDKVEVRQALKLVTDRQALVDTVLLGYGEVGNDNPVPLGSPFAYTGEAPKRDIAKAKELLAKAGYTDANPLKVDIFTGDGVPGLDRMTEAYAEMAKEAGIEVTVNKVPPDSYWDDTWLKKSFLTSAWSMRPPGEGLAYPYRAISDVNETHWKRADFDDLLTKASTALTDDERTKYYKDAQKLLAEEGGVIIPMFVHQVLAVRKGCGGYEPHPQNFNLDFSTIECK
jgi:peptide/nickel transport system substrate-binding protein